MNPASPILLLFILGVLNFSFGNTKKTINTVENRSTNLTLVCDTFLTPSHYHLHQIDSVLQITFSKWRKEKYAPLLKKYKIGSFNCSGGCEGIRAIIRFKINAEGKMEELILKDGVKCSEKFDEKFKKDYLNSFNDLVFPTAVRNNCYEDTLGAILKC